MIAVDTTFLPDLWIAVRAIQGNAPLVTLNTKHFGEIPGLELILY